MVTETVNVFHGLDIEAPTGGGTTYVWSDPQYWPLARDKNLAIVFMDVTKIGSGVTAAIVAEDSAGRIFKALTLSSPSTQNKDQVRVVIQNFAANLKIGVSIYNASTNNGATITLEYALKAY